MDSAETGEQMLSQRHFNGSVPRRKATPGHQGAHNVREPPILSGLAPRGGAGVGHVARKLTMFAA